MIDVVRARMRAAVSVALFVTGAVGTGAAFAADAAKGEAAFKPICGICHATAAGGPVLGPNLIGVVGRKAGTQPEFKMYSKALQDSGLTWDTKTLDEFLQGPMNKVPGTTMPMLIADPVQRADVIAYLASLKK